MMSRHTSPIQVKALVFHSNQEAVTLWQTWPRNDWWSFTWTQSVSERISRISELCRSWQVSSTSPDTSHKLDITVGQCFSFEQASGNYGCEIKLYAFMPKVGSHVFRSQPKKGLINRNNMFTNLHIRHACTITDDLVSRSQNKSFQ